MCKICDFDPQLCGSYWVVGDALICDHCGNFMFPKFRFGDCTYFGFTMDLRFHVFSLPMENFCQHCGASFKQIRILCKDENPNKHSVPESVTERNENGM